jgi:alpha-tubulin suppressor-like RCC1 family protein
MEYVQGITLTEYVRQKGPLPVEEAVAIASQVLTILSYAYSKGIQAHRDIKPGNIMIDLRTHAVTVMDFGIAKTVGSSLTHSTVLYTPKYAAPEQLLPSKFGGVVDKRADLYALGVVLYEMLTGKAPFTGETPAEISGEQITSSPPSPSSIRRDIPAPLSQVLLKCLQSNPSARYQTPEDLLQDLTAGHVRETRQTPSPARDDQPTVIGKGSAPGQEPLHPPVPAPEQKPPRRRSRVLIPLLLTLLVAAIVPLTMLVLRNRRGDTAVTSDNSAAVTPSQQTATLTITSTPEGAEVLLDGTKIGTTPLTKNDVTPGTHTLRLTLVGYSDYSTMLAPMQAGGEQTVHPTLSKTGGASTAAILTVASAPSGAKVLLDDISIGTTPITQRTVTPGSHVVRLTLAGYKDYSTTLTLQAGEIQTVNPVLAKAAVASATGTLSITSTPSGARIYLAGKDTTKTTPNSFKLTPGTYAVKVTKDGYNAYQGSVAITQAGTTKTLPVTLTKTVMTPATATLTITSTPTSTKVYLDGTSIGTTPITKKEVAPGAHALRVTLAGYNDYTTSVALKAGDDEVVAVSLTKAPIVMGQVLAITAGWETSMAIARDRSLWAWGDNAYGQLGDGNRTSAGTPVCVGTRIDWLSIATSGLHSLGVTLDGSLWAWGRNADGELGIGTMNGHWAPVRVGTNSDWTTVAAGHGASFGLARDGSLWAWGLDNYARVGDGTTGDSTKPIRSAARSDWAAISTDGYSYFGLTRDGSLWAWGYNGSGQLGDGTTTNRPTPVRVGTRTDWTAIAADGSSCRALARDGSLWAWGNNSYGQLGDGTTTNRPTPVRVGTRTDWTAIAAGGDHSLAVASDGSLWSWGKGDHGQLGDESWTDRLTPVRVGSGG